MVFMDKIEISQLIRSRRRTIALLITPDARLTVRAPLQTPLSYIEKLVDRKSDWIRRKVAQIHSRKSAHPLPQGDKFLYLGRSYDLEAYDGKSIYFGDKLFFPREILPHLHQEISFWYKQEARQIIPGRVEHYAAVMGVKYREIQMSDARSRWGSCSPTGAVRFSWRLIMAPLAVVDYVVVHELVHLKIRDHSRRFWNEVARYCPAYPEFRAWLRKNEQIIGFPQL